MGGGGKALSCPGAADVGATDLAAVFGLGLCGFGFGLGGAADCRVAMTGLGTNVGESLGCTWTDTVCGK